MSPGLQLRPKPPGGIVEEDPPGHYVMWLGNQAQVVAHRCYDSEKHDYGTMLGGMRLIRIDPDIGLFTIELFYEAVP